MERRNTWLKVALAFAIVGAINWGLIGFFNWNLVDAIFGGGSFEETSGISRVIYAVVGLAGLACLALFGYRFVESDKALPSGRRAEVRP